MTDRKAPALPALPDGAPGKPPQDRYRKRQGVIVVCEDEADQKAIYEGLQAMRRGKVKVVNT